MLKTILARIHQKHRTLKYPDEPAQLPELFRGYPVLNAEACPADCRLCADACPFGAISRNGNCLSLDMANACSVRSVPCRAPMEPSGSAAMRSWRRELAGI